MRFQPIRFLAVAGCGILFASCGDQPVAPDFDAPTASYDHLPTDDGAPGVVVTGPGSGAATVNAFDAATAENVRSFLAYEGTAGVRVAAGDVNGDGVSDIVTGAGAGAGPHVKVFDGATGAEIMSFFAYDPAFTGGVYVGAGDVDWDGQADIVTGAGAGGGPHVKVFSGATGAEIMSFLAYPGGFTGGVTVASGDVNGDGYADVVTGPGAGGSGLVKVFSGFNGSELMAFFAYPFGFESPVFVAAGDVNGDWSADVITSPGQGAAAHVKVFSGATGGEMTAFFAYPVDFLGGASVASADLDHDGHADIVTGAGAGGGPHVKVFNGNSGAETASFFAYPVDFTGGVFVAAGHGIGEDDGGDDEDPVPPTFDDLLAAVDAAVADGTLTGEGKGSSAKGRLKAWTNMLKSADKALESGDTDDACSSLREALRRADGEAPPPDFVSGEAREEIAAMIQELMEATGCGA